MDHQKNYKILKQEILNAMAFHLEGDDESAFFRIGIVAGKLTEWIEE